MELFDRDNIFGISKPTLLLDADRARGHITAMARKAEASGVRFRPHVKTHQAAAVGEWFREVGVRAVTVSSVTMAGAVASCGWTDVTIAFPLNPLEIDAIDDLAGRIDLGVLIDSEEAIACLERVRHAVSVWIKVDVGYGRVGVRWDRADRLLTLAAALQRSDRHELAGLLTHSGHSYHATGVGELREIYAQTVARLEQARSALGEPGRRCGLSLGDTPTCSVVDDFSAVDEIRPGNFVFYDAMQQRLGACADDDIAVTVACPVVGKYEERGQIVIYGGAVHFGKEFVGDASGQPVYGFLARWRDGRPAALAQAAPVISLSQEHGVVRLDRSQLDRCRIGDVVYVYPIHACLTCGLYREYRLLGGGVIPRLEQ